MALKFQPSFSAGELDPALHERTNLQKYDSALATARNVVVGKSGRLISRPARKGLWKAKLADRECVIHTMSNIGVLLEWGHEYVHVYRMDGTFQGEFAHDWTEEMLPNIRFCNIGQYHVLVTAEGFVSKFFRAVGLGETIDISFGGEASFERGFVEPLLIYTNPVAPTKVSIVDHTSTGYDVEYIATVIVNGEESPPVVMGAAKLPITAGTSVTLTASFADVSYQYYKFFRSLKSVNADYDVAVSQMRFYRRPTGGGAYGFIGASSAGVAAAGVITFIFTDLGAEADYTNQPPDYGSNIIAITPAGELPFASNLKSLCASLYQQRLLLSDGEIIEASRTGYPYNFKRDFPIASDSALTFKAGSDDYAKVLYYIESDGMVVFTSKGVYLHNGVLSPTNLGLAKKGNWVIDKNVPPLAVPGGVLFVDSSTNTVRQLSFSQELQSYEAKELSIFSDHLFVGNKIKSWAFHEGEVPLLWAAFDDGTFATFTYEREQQMRAWTRGDSGFGIERIASSGAGIDYLGEDQAVTVPQIFFVTNKNGQRWIECGVPRYVSAEIIEEDSESELNPTIAAVDGMSSWKRIINDDLAGGDILTLTPVTPTVWNGPLTLDCQTSALFTPTDLGIIGTKFKYFDSDLTSIVMEVTARASDNSVTVMPESEFPLAAASDVRLYLAKNSFSTEREPIYQLLTYFVDQVALDTLTMSAVVGGVWNGVLNLLLTRTTVKSGSFIGDASQGFYRPVFVGQILRHYLTSTTWMELEVIEVTDALNIKLQPTNGATYPSADTANPDLWICRDTFNVEHLEGESISVIADGYVVASPNNNIENYDVIIVTDGVVTLPVGSYGAIVHFGRPYTADVETLDIDTVEQRPVLIESDTLNKIYMKVFRSRGLYIANEFPADDVVLGMSTSGLNEIRMDDRDTIPIDYADGADGELIGNRYERPRTVRREISLPGDWKSAGRVCVRQVDPLHFEILSFIPDLTDLAR